jgi:YtkA-like protein
MFSHTSEFPLIGDAPQSVRQWTRSAFGVAGAALAAIVAGVLATSFGDATVQPEPPTSAIASGTVVSLGTRLSHNGRYRAEVEAGAPLAIGEAQAWTIRLARRNHRRVANARMAVQAWMPETGEASPMRASARYIGAGRYRVDGIYFSTPGWWNVAVTVQGPNGVDSLAFNVVLPRN